MSPRYKSAQYQHEWDEAREATATALAPEAELPEGVEVRSGRPAQLSVNERSPYGPDSEHS